MCRFVRNLNLLGQAVWSVGTVGNIFQRDVNMDLPQVPWICLMIWDDLRFRQLISWSVDESSACPHQGSSPAPPTHRSLPSRWHRPLPLGPHAHTRTQTKPWNMWKDWRPILRCQLDSMSIWYYACKIKLYRKVVNWWRVTKNIPEKLKVSSLFPGLPPLVTLLSGRQFVHFVASLLPTPSDSPSAWHRRVSAIG